jgi:hypothetical protein
VRGAQKKGLRRRLRPDRGEALVAYARWANPEAFGVSAAKASNALRGRHLPFTLRLDDGSETQFVTHPDALRCSEAGLSDQNDFQRISRRLSASTPASIRCLMTRHP